MGPTPVSRYRVFFFFLFFSFLFLGWLFGLVFFFILYIYISFGELGTKKKKKKKLYRLTSVGPMNSVKKLSDENKSDVAK